MMNSKKASAAAPRIMMKEGHTNNRGNVADGITLRQHRTTTTRNESSSSSSGGGVEIRQQDFDIVLLLDNREVRKKDDRTYIHEQLVGMGVKCEVRSLALGDVLWIARLKEGVTLPNRWKSREEYILNVVVERKKLEDLWSSIKDGRYYEQKVIKLIINQLIILNNLI